MTSVFAEEEMLLYFQVKPSSGVPPLYSPLKSNLTFNTILVIYHRRDTTAVLTQNSSERGIIKTSEYHTRNAKNT